jgi:hypothetical protein
VGGPEALNDRQPQPDRVWDRIPDATRDNVIEPALDEPALSLRELAERFTDSHSYFVSEASVYRLLKARDLIASSASTMVSNIIRAAAASPQTVVRRSSMTGWCRFTTSTPSACRGC